MNPQQTKQQFVLDASKYDGHTPGEWIPNRFDSNSPITVCGVEGGWVCKVSSEGNWALQSERLQKTNATLIADAPQLLALCVEQAAEIDRLQALCTEVRCLCMQEAAEIDRLRALCGKGRP